MNQKAIRDSWEAYAVEHGLTREVTHVQLGRESLPASLNRQKYGSVKTTVDGLVFDSVKEASYYEQLKLRELAGDVAEIEIKPKYPLHVMELWRSGTPIRITTIGYYELDFRFLDLRTGERKTVDVKSEGTRSKEAYRIKKKLVEAVHGITIDEE